MSDFDGLVAAVTGGASGIGAATADAARRARSAGGRPRSDDGTRQRSSSQRRLRHHRRRRHRRGHRSDRDEHRRPRHRSSTTPASVPSATLPPTSARSGHRVLDVNVVWTRPGHRAALPLLRQSEHAAIVNVCVGRVAWSACANERSTRRRKGGVARHDPGDGGRLSRRRHPGELRRSRHGRHPLGRPAARQRRDPRGRGGQAEVAAAHRSTGHRRRGRARDRLPRQPAVGLDYRHHPRRRRRHGHPPHHIVVENSRPKGVPSF